MSAPVTIEAWPEPVAPGRSVPTAPLSAVAARFGITVPTERIHVRLHGATFDILCKWTSSKNGRHITGFDLTVKSSPRPKILLRLEQPRDHDGKALGLNREVQTGDASFDGHVYVESAAGDRAVLETLGVAAVRHAVLELLSRGATQLDLGPELIEAKFPLSVPSDAAFDPDRVLAPLDAFARLLAAMPQATLEVPRAGAGAVEGGCGGLVLILGLPLVSIVLYILSWTTRDTTGLVGYRPFVIGAGVGVVAAVLCSAIGFVRVRLRPSATGFRRWIGWIVFSLLCALPIATPALLVIDRFGARGEPTVVDVQVIDVVSGGGEWELTTTSWIRAGGSEHFETEDFVGGSGTPVRLTVRRGRLGFSWVVRAERISAP